MNINFFSNKKKILKWTWNLSSYAKDGEKSFKGEKERETCQSRHNDYRSSKKILKNHFLLKKLTLTQKWKMAKALTPYVCMMIFLSTLVKRKCMQISFLCYTNIASLIQLHSIHCGWWWRAKENRFSEKFLLHRKLVLRAKALLFKHMENFGKFLIIFLFNNSFEIITKYFLFLPLGVKS